jgi:hypothetical protein
MYATRFEALLTVPSGASVAATNSGGAATAVSLTAGSYTPTQFAAHLQTRLNAVRTPANWTVAISYTTGLCTIDCVGETWALTFTTAAAGTVLGFVGNIGSTTDPAVGTQNCRGLYMPDCPLVTDGHPSMALLDTDVRSTESPTGGVYTIGSTSKYRQGPLRMSHVPVARIREGSAATAYASWEAWLKDTQLGAGHSWFSYGSAFQVYWDNAGSAALVGADLNSGSGPANGWKFSPAISRIDPKLAAAPWLGVWSLETPGLVTEG